MMAILSWFSTLASTSPLLLLVSVFSSSHWQPARPLPPSITTEWICHRKSSSTNGDEEKLEIRFSADTWAWRHYPLRRFNFPYCNLHGLKITEDSLQWLLIVNIYGLAFPLGNLKKNMCFQLGFLMIVNLFDKLTINKMQGVKNFWTWLLDMMLAMHRLVHKLRFWTIFLPKTQL